MAENFLPKMYVIRQTNCTINCPCLNCEATYETMSMFEKLSMRERTRLCAILNEIASSSHQILQTLRSTIFDILTMKCPSCRVPIDPFPDACSAVMCLNCGKHYCNYCFMTFDDRGPAHEHVSTHSSNSNVRADPFLSKEIVSEGQKLYRINELEKFALMSLSSTDTSIDWSQFLQLSLILCIGELEDIEINIFEFWKSVKAKYLNTRLSSDSSSTESSTQSSDETMMTEATEIEYPNIVPTQSSSTTASNLIANNTNVPRQGAILLCNALISENHEAATQIIKSFQNEIDVNVIEPSLDCPIASLAILCEEREIAIHLFMIGANPLLTNREQRNSIYIACEYGYQDVLECIYNQNPDLLNHINEPVTEEIQKYTPLQVAARYVLNYIIKMFL